MLLRFSVSNYRSILEPQEISLVASSLADEEGALIQPDNLPYQVLRAAAIFGPNASGKSNMLLGLRFMKDAVKNSQTKWAPVGIRLRSFALADAEEEPSEFSVDFLLDGIRYEYGFSMDKTKVLHEYLFAYPENRRQRWFERRWDAEQISFGKNLPGENKAIANLTRPNSLFLSAAAQNNHEKLLPVYNWFSNKLNFKTGTRMGPPLETIRLCVQDNEIRDRVFQFMKAADLGIVGIEIEEERHSPESLALGEKLKTLMKEIAPESTLDLNQDKQTISFQHRGHKGQAVTLPIQSESDGTIAYLAILGPIVETLATGGLLCVDELDASLHPLLVDEIVRLFNRKETNPRGAQLIFNSHDTQLLNGPLLRRDQIWFTEKDKTGATRLYPLSDFKPRRAENLQRGYLQGRYGATPIIHSPLSTERG